LKFGLTVFIIFSKINQLFGKQSGYRNTFWRMNRAELRVFFLCLFAFSANGVAIGDSLDIHEGFRYFELRAENTRECIADASNIDRSIYHFQKAIESHPDPGADVIVGLLKAYEFKGARTEGSSADKIKVFEKGIALGKEMMDAYPLHSGIKYWYMANLGRWAQEVGVMKASRAHVASEIKEIAEWMMANDPQYDGAGAYRILGTMHMELPRIPFVLSWPSDEEGLTLLSQAVELAPEHYGNSLRYARALLKEGKDEEAWSLLASVEHRQPRKKTYLEDLHNLTEIRSLLATRPQ
jgi:tetratricopeptide (TPR) repeat protein